MTHPGRVRETNEDALAWDVDLELFVVADGMGGHNAGDVASRLAVDAIRAFLLRSRGNEVTWPFGLSPTHSFAGNRLMTSIKLANRRVFRAGESRDDYTGLGTTVVAALFEEGQVVYSGVGDSRIYSFLDGRLDQLTEDDSWAATVLAGDPTMDRAALAAHPMRHVLTDVLGAREHLDVDVHERAVRPGETFLLCSDGLHGALDRATLERVLGSGKPVDAMSHELVQLALDRDGSDNVSAMIVRTEA